MKHNALLCNAGHFNVEVSETDLRRMAVRVWPRRAEIMGYELPDEMCIRDRSSTASEI